MTERRCPHGFMRSQVRCPEGCPLPEGKVLTTEGNVRRVFPKPPKASAPKRVHRQYLSTVGDGRILEALRTSEHATAAATKLGTTQVNLYLYCRGKPGLSEAYMAAAKRGMKGRGARGRATGFAPWLRRKEPV